MKTKAYFVQLLQFFFLVSVSLTLSSCTSLSGTQAQVNNLAVGGRYPQALNILSDPKKYGNNNQLLYLFDKGLVQQLSGDYDASIETFEAAKEKYEELYTQSLSKGVASWLWNDTALPYRGEDFERIMLNIFQSLNYASLGQMDDALVEARDVDSKLSAFNARYEAKHKNSYSEDAFARLLMGLFYEADGNLNDALVSYRLSLEAYEKGSAQAIPLVLKQNLLSAAEGDYDRHFEEYRERFSDIEYVSWKERQKHAEVYLIEYQGISPKKVSAQIPIPLPDGYISQLAFPSYQKQPYRSKATKFLAVSLEDKTERWDKTEKVEDIEEIAIKNLQDRQVRTIAKAAVRLAGKYVAERSLERNVQKSHGSGTADAFRLVSSLYNFISEQADVRSWQTLPGEIRIGRLILEPGQYEIFGGEESFGTLDLQAGEKRFLILRD